MGDTLCGCVKAGRTMGFDAVRRFLARLREHEPRVGPEEARVLGSMYCILSSLRDVLVEAFDELSARRMRGVYDDFSYMMLEFDKLHQLLRRVAGRRECSGIDDELTVLPVDLSAYLRRLYDAALELRDVARSGYEYGVRSGIAQVSTLVGEIARYLDSKVFR